MVAVEDLGDVMGVYSFDPEGEDGEAVGRGRRAVDLEVGDLG